MGSIVKVIEVIAQSDKGFDDAARSAVKEAAKTIKGSSRWIDNLSARRRRTGSRTAGNARSPSCSMFRKIVR